MSAKRETSREFKQFCNQIKKEFPYAYDKCHFYYGDNSKSPKHNVDKNQSEKYVVCLFPAHGVFIVWDYELHKKHSEKGASKSTVCLGKEWEDITTSTFPYYKKMGTRKDAPYEKVFVVLKEDSHLFFRNIDEYMCHNCYDVDEFGERINSSIVKQEDTALFSDEKRKRYSSQKLQRKSAFKNAVIEVYGHQCAVCRTKVHQVLQAAHLHDFEVADTDLSADTVEHGICLCANHHLMYDSGIIDFDLTKKKVNVLDNSLMNTDAYQIIREHNFTLVDRNAE